MPRKSLLARMRRKRFWSRAFRSFFGNIKAIIKNNVFLIVVCLLFLTAFLAPYQKTLQIVVGNERAIRGVLSGIVGALASILGIIVAILLVAFELLRKTYASYAFREFFQNKYLKNLFVLFISTILISVFSLLILKDPPTVRAAYLSYLSILLFIACMLALYPCAKRILTTTTSKAKIAEIVNRIDNQAISSLGIFRPHMSPPHYLAIMEENPLFILSEVAIRTISDRDRLTPKFVLVESARKLLQLLKNTDDSHRKREIINAFLTVFRHCAKQAIMERQDGTVITTLDVMRDIGLLCAKNKEAWHTLIEFNETWQEIIQATIEHELDEIARRGLWDIKEVLKKNLEENVPAENEIWLFRDFKDEGDAKPGDHDKSLQWENATYTYFSMIDQLTEIAIQFKRGRVVWIALHNFNEIQSEVTEMNLGDGQKGQIIGSCSYYVRTLTIKSADKGLYGDVLRLSLNHSILKKILDKKAAYSKEPLLNFCQTLIELGNRQVFDTFAFNDLGTLGRSITEKIDIDVLYQEALLLICQTFDKIREGIVRSDKPEKQKAYREVYRQIESLKKWLENKGKHNEILENEITSALAKFKELDSYEEKIIDWPNISTKKTTEKET